MLRTSKVLGSLENLNSVINLPSKYTVGLDEEPAWGFVAGAGEDDVELVVLA